MPKAYKGVKAPVAGKTQFLGCLVEFLLSQGVVIMRNGTASRSKEDFWKLYKALKRFEVAVAVASGRLSLAGVGRFQVKLSGRKLPLRPIFKFYQSVFFDNFLRVNKKMLTESRELDAETIYTKTFSILAAMEAACATVPDQIEQDNTIRMEL